MTGLLLLNLSVTSLLTALVLILMWRVRLYTPFIAWHALWIVALVTFSLFLTSLTFFVKTQCVVSYVLLT